MVREVCKGFGDTKSIICVLSKKCDGIFKGVGVRPRRAKRRKCSKVRGVEPILWFCEYVVVIEKVKLFIVRLYKEVLWLNNRICGFLRS